MKSGQQKLVTLDLMSSTFHQQPTKHKSQFTICCSQRNVGLVDNNKACMMCQ